MPKELKRIAVTGSAGQIAYSLLLNLCQGDAFGLDQPIALHLLEIPSALPILEGIKMELEDCAFPLLKEIHIGTDPFKLFVGVHYALLIGSKPRGPGMERKELLQENGKIFVEQGKALHEVAHSDVQVFVVGNPCNTNCLIALKQGTRLPPEHFYAMTRLDQNRATFQLARKANVDVSDITHMAIWGNHSSTQVPDFFHACIKGKSADSILNKQWLENDFFTLIQKRGAEIIQARGKSSAFSAARALIESIKDTLQPTLQNQWFSSGIYSSKNPYAIDSDLIFSFPCQKEKEICIVPGLDLNDFLLSKIKLSEKELIEERDLVKDLLNPLKGAHHG